MNIYQFDHYKDYLVAWIESQKNNGRGQINIIANAINIKPSLLSAILSTERNITMEQAIELNQYFKHEELESEYFIILVSLDRAGTYKLKDHYLKQKAVILKKSEKIKSRIKFENSVTEEQRTKYYSKSLYSLIRILSSLEAGISLEDIMKLTKENNSQVKDAIEDLLEFGLIREQDKKFFSTNKNIHIGKESPHYIHHRSNWLLEQMQKSPSSSSRNLNFTCPCTISLNDFEKIKSILLDSIAKSHAVIDQSPAEMMACLTIDFLSYLE
jgi:uncharacterized protein (TIGR02147 family)